MIAAVLALLIPMTDMKIESLLKHVPLSECSCDGDCLVIPRDPGRITGNCLATGSTRTRQYPKTTVILKRSILSRIWLAIVLVGLIGHRTFAALAWGIDLSLTHSSIVLMLGLASLLVVFDYVSIMYPLAPKVVPQKSRLSDRGWRFIVFRLGFLASILPVLVVTWSLDAPWMPRLLGESLLIAAVIFFGFSFGAFCLSRLDPNGTDRGVISVKAATRNSVWLGGVSDSVLAPLPSFADSRFSQCQ